MKFICFYLCAFVSMLFLHCYRIGHSTRTENITNPQFDDDDPSKYLNNVSNMSNSMPELIEYYDVDDVSSAPDAIYPDPDALFNVKSKENRKSNMNERHFGDINSDSAGGSSNSNSIISGTTKLSELQELDEPGDLKNAIANHDNSLKIDATHTSFAESSGVDRMKSIDFEMNQHTFHTMEELKNEDLRDHDIIDNIMYIYYGSNVALRKSLGGSIIIVGTVFALAAQILAIIFMMLRNR